MNHWIKFTFRSLYLSFSSPTGVLIIFSFFLIIITELVINIGDIDTATNVCC
jgi:hypothetical protein